MRALGPIIAGCTFGAAMLAVHPATLLGQDPARPTPKAEQLTREQFDALREDQSIEVRGKVMTKREILATVAKQSAEAKAKAEAAEKEFEAAAASENENFSRSEDARIEKENAQTRAEAPPADPEETPAQREIAQVRAEAVQLRARAAKTTSEAELTEIHRRAQQLLAQLKRNQGGDR